MSQELHAVKTRQRAKRRGEPVLPPKDSPYNRSPSPNDIALGQEEEMEQNSVWHDAPLFAAILPVLGAVFLGADYIQDVILFLCVTWYLHMLIRVPWNLYTLSRPRPRGNKNSLTAEQKAAENSLEWRSLLYLLMSLLAPFLGLRLLRTILMSVGSATGSTIYITYFHSTLFILVAGIRPLKHLIALLTGHTRELQGVVHLPPQDEIIAREIKLEAKVDQLDTLLGELAGRLRTFEISKAEDIAKREERLLSIQDSFDITFSKLQENIRQREKQSDMVVEVLERKVEGMEKKLDTVSRMALALSKDDQPNRDSYFALAKAINGNGLLDRGSEPGTLAFRMWTSLESMWGSFKHPTHSTRPDTPHPSNNGGFLFPAKKGHHPHHSQVVSTGGIKVKGGSPLVVRKRDGGVQSNLQTVLEEESELEVHDIGMHHSPINGHRASASEPDLQHGRPPVRKARTLPTSTTLRIPVNGVHSNAGRELQVRFQRQHQEGLFHITIRLLFAPLRFVRRVFFGLLGSIIRS